MSKFERYEMRTVDRSTLKNAEYNPRALTNQARARLKKGIEKHGLVQPIIFNESTGNVVGGHQRLSILDDLESGAAYQLQVAVIRVSLSDERKINVLLNNDGAQGHWDETKLLALFAGEEDLDLDGLGFSTSQAEYYDKLLRAADSQDDEIMRAMMDASELHQDVEFLGNSNVEERHKKKLERKTKFEQQVSSLMVPQDSSTWKLKTPEEKKAYDNARENFREEPFEIVTLRISFSTLQAKKDFLTRHGLPFKDTIHESELYGNTSGAGSADVQHQGHQSDDTRQGRAL